MGNCKRHLENLSTSEADVYVYGSVKDYQGAWLWFSKDFRPPEARPSPSLMASHLALSECYSLGLLCTRNGSNLSIRHPRHKSGSP